MVPVPSLTEVQRIPSGRELRLRDAPAVGSLRDYNSVIMGWNLCENPGSCPVIKYLKMP
jgi:hypothetical protein